MKKVAIGIFAFILITVGTYWGSVYLSINGLRSALQNQDATALQQYVDFPRLRDQLRSEARRSLAAHLAREANREKGNTFGAGLLNVIGPAMIGQLIDTMITPEGLVALMRENKTPTASTKPVAVNPKGELTAFDEYTLSLAGEDRKSPKIIFERYGLTWRVVRIVFEPGQSPWETASNAPPTGTGGKATTRPAASANISDLQIDIVSTRSMDDLKVDGAVSNRGDSKRKVPHLRIYIRDRNKNTLVAKVIEPPVAELEAGARATFSTVFEHATIMAKDAAATFVLN